jgi:DNA repair protein RecO (recombination protein O)
VQYKDASRILTVLTGDLGKVTVTARGAVRKNSKLAPCVQPLAFSDMTLFKSKDRWTLTEAQCIELFTGLQDDLARFALGAYFAQLLENVSDEDSPGPRLLSLGLNALYVLGIGKREDELVKAAFETRLMCLSGYAPDIARCAVCGSEKITSPRLLTQEGTIVCGKCFDGGADVKSATLCDASYLALRHICGCDEKRLFSFKLSRDALRRLAVAAEEFTLAQLDREFGTLDYYKSVKDLSV